MILAWVERWWISTLPPGRPPRFAESCSPKPDWRPRKEAYITRLPGESPSVRLVSASDKLHNARAILSDYHAIGEALWGRFTGKKGGTLWYYRELVPVFLSAGPRRLGSEADNAKIIFWLVGL